MPGAPKYWVPIAEASAIASPWQVLASVKVAVSASACGQLATRACTVLEQSGGQGSPRPSAGQSEATLAALVAVQSVGSFGSPPTSPVTALWQLEISGMIVASANAWGQLCTKREHAAQATAAVRQTQGCSPQL